MEVNPFIYNKFIDPLLGSLRKRMLSYIPEGKKVIDIASGTGQFVRELSVSSERATGIDIEPGMVNYSKNRNRKGNDQGISFFEADAKNLYLFEDGSFDIATLSLALHQFDPEDWNPVLSEIFRIAEVLIIGDYSHPLPSGIKKAIVYSIERLAGRQHYLNFKSYMRNGGVLPIVEKNALECTNYETTGSMIFSVFRISKK